MQILYTNSIKGNKNSSFCKEKSIIVRARILSLHFCLEISNCLVPHLNHMEIVHGLKVGVSKKNLFQMSHPLYKKNNENGKKRCKKPRLIQVKWGVKYKKNSITTKTSELAAGIK